AYWKLLIILIMLETYGVWRGDSLFNIAVNSVFGSPTDPRTASGQPFHRVSLDIAPILHPDP
ncbi:Protein ARV1, partial [Operophtera brumata]